MRQLHIFGSSHAARILQAALNNDNIRQNFSVTGTVRPGAKFNNLVFPSKLLNSFVESDVLLIQLFGNELLKRNVYVSHLNGNKTIHLTAFEPEPAWKIQGVYRRLKELLEPLKCEIFILDNPLRYARCCTFHKKRLKGLPKFLAMQNRVLAQNFGSKVLNHKKYLGLPTKRAYDQKIYQKLFSDSVHFKKNVYDSLVQWVAKRHLLID